MENMKKKRFPVIFSNLQKASEKQQDFEAADLFGRLASDYDDGEATAGSFEELLEQSRQDLSEAYAELQAAAAGAGDRGAQRALVWGRR